MFFSPRIEQYELEEAPTKPSVKPNYSFLAICKNSGVISSGKKQILPQKKRNLSLDNFPWNHQSFCSSYRKIKNSTADTPKPKLRLNLQNQKTLIFHIAMKISLNIQTDNFVKRSFSKTTNRAICPSKSFNKTNQLIFTELVKTHGHKNYHLCENGQYVAYRIEFFERNYDSWHIRSWLLL